MNTRALRCSRQIGGCGGGRQHLVDDMDDPVARGHIGDGDRCVVDHDVVANAEGQGLTVHRSSGHAVGDIEERTLAGTTWYNKMSVSVAFPSGVSKLARSIPASVNA